MDFTKYPSIENSYREKFINQIISEGYSNYYFVVTSKLDGANFSFICNGKNVIYASRNNKVGTDFFNCQKVVDKYSNEVIKLFELLNHNSDVKQIQVYGELIGDGINGRVKYCKDREFFVFDVLVTKGDKSYFLDYDVLRSYTACCDRVNLELVPLHFTGKLEECLEYCNHNIKFKSLIPTILDNEYALLDTNYDEGFVIRPVQDTYLNRGDRIILKVKSPEFSEKETKDKSIKIPSELSPEDTETLNKLRELITESRVYSVISKIGKLSPNSFGEILGLYTKDVMEEFNKENTVKLNKEVKKELNKLIVNVIKPVWMKIV